MKKIMSLTPLGCWDFASVLLPALILWSNGLLTHALWGLDTYPFDADSGMRLAFLTWDIQTRHSILANVLVPLFGAPDGASLHWTLPYDLLVTMMAALPACFVGWHQAFIDAVWGLNLVTDIFLMMATRSLCRSTGLGCHAVWACMIVSVSPSIVQYSCSSGMNHHIFMVALMVWALSRTIAFTRRPTAPEAILCASAITLAAWESMEAVPMVVVCSAIIVVMAYLRGAQWQTGKVALVSAFLILPVAALAFDPGTHGFWAMDADRFSLIHVMGFAAAALLVVVAHKGRNVRWQMAIPIIGILAALIALPLAEVFLHAYHDLFPSKEVNQEFWAHVGELLPASTNPTYEKLVWLPSGPGLIAGLWLCWRKRKTRAALGVASYCAVLFALTVLANQHERMALLPSVLASVPIGVVISQAVRSFLVDGLLWQRSVVIAGLVALCMVYSNIEQAQKAAASTQSNYLGCQFGPIAAREIRAILPEGSVILSDISGQGADDLLMRDGASYPELAAGYHRAIAAIDDGVTFFSSRDNAVLKDIALRRHIAAVSVCRARAHFQGSVIDRVQKGQLPWMKESKAGSSPSEILYLVNKDILSK